MLTLFQLETWYVNENHQRTDIQVTLATGEKITIGTILNGTESWSYRIDPGRPGMTRAVHQTKQSQTPGRYLFAFGNTADIIAMYTQQGCHIAQKPYQGTLVNRKITVITVDPTHTCQTFDIPNNALIYNNINYYQTQTPVTSTKKSEPGPMTVWVDKETSVVLQAQRTTANNLPWDQYRVTSLEYSPKVPAHLLDYVPPPGMIIITNPSDGEE